MAIQNLSGRNVARARRDAQINGKAALSAKASTSMPAAPVAKAAVQAAVTPLARPTAKAVPRSVKTSTNSGREASRARRRNMSEQGKAGVATDRIATAKRNSRIQEEDCGCGCKGSGGCGDATAVRETAPQLAVPKATNGSRRNEVKAVTASSAGRLNSRLRRDALAAQGKTGADAYRKGVSSAQMVRHQNPDISGRDLARTLRSQRSTAGGNSTATPSSGRTATAGRRRPERADNSVSGTRVSHSEKTTGDETGLCRTVTGTDYFSSDVFADFCQKDVPFVPRKVESSENLSGGVITASGNVGRSENVTGNERGSCRTVTGVEYVGREQYDDFCQSKPEPGNAKVSFSQTTRGQIISGSKPARSRQVSGDEVGTCQAVTGTPYAGVEQFRDFCEPGESKLTEVRNQRRSGNAGRDITGMQPGFSGLTGAGKGACRDVSGTSYIGATHHQEVCGALPAQMDEPDFPRPLADAPWGAFSLLQVNQTQNQAAPLHASQKTPVKDGVTGMRYEQGRVSGTFSLGEGKITGTEQFRSNEGKSRAKAAGINAREVAALPAATLMDEAKATRVTGEGMELSMKITGNDWNRGDRVTGTEGTSAIKRNPTRRGPISAMSTTAPKRNEEVERSDINVTGGSGTFEKGAPVTLSGGARG